MRIEEITEDVIIFDNGNVMRYIGKIIPDFYEAATETSKEYPEDLYFEKREHGFAFGHKDGWKTYITCYTEDGDYTRDYPDILYKEKFVFNY